MKYLPDPQPLVKALRDLLAELTREHPEIADTMPSAVNARPILDLAEDPAVHSVPVLEKYGCPDTDLDALLSYVDGMFAALAALRSGELVLDGTRDPATLARLADGIGAVGHRLAPRVQGLLDALTNAHYEAGGSHAELARALDAERSAVAKRSIRRRVSGPGEWEKWALGETDPGEYLAAEVRPGWIVFDENGKRHQAQMVSVYGDGLVDVGIGTTALVFAPGAGITAIPRPAQFVETTGEITGQTFDGKPMTSPMKVTTYARARRAPAA